jgi:AcrR family transcriptional regulator
MVYRQTKRSAKVRQESRTRILAAARKLFALKGYEQTTMQEIVREAGTSIGNAYFYFENKEGMVMALVEEGLRATWTRIDPIIASVEPGASRIAVSVYANTMTLLGSEKDLAGIAVAGMPAVVRHLTHIMWERICVLFRDNFPERDPQEVLAISAAIFGANRTIAELCLTGVLKVQAEDMAKFLVRWHLRALQLPERQIDRIVQIASRAYKTQHATPSARRNTATRPAHD